MQPDLVRDRAIRLFSYLRELSLMRTPVIKDIDRYESVLWWDELPNHNSIKSIEREPIGEDEDLWLEITRVAEPRLEAPPLVLDEWFDAHLLHDSDSEPKLRSESLRWNQDGTTRKLKLEDFPELNSEWDRYLITTWRPWAAQHRQWRVLYGWYARVFSMYQQIQKLGEAYELVLTLGFLIWKTPNGLVRRHILAGGAELEFEPERGVLSVRGSSEGVRLHLETEMLEMSERPSNEPALAAQIEQIAETPWDRPRIISILESWVHSASPGGNFSENATTAGPSTEPTLLLRPALVLRKRSGRSIVDAFATIIDDLKKGGAIPHEVQRLCAITDTAMASPDDASPSQTHPVTSVYFPLPANDEQLQIAERVRKAPGVLVQGPPGTGKSHTIANLVCDLLANGKRVLVTSQTPRALKVLKDKIPAAIAPIAVVVLGNDSRGLGDLEESIGGITNRYARYDKDQSERRTAELEQRLRAAEEERARCRSRMRDRVEKDTITSRVAPGYEGTPMEIAKSVASREADFSWFRDRPTPGAELKVSGPTLLQALTSLREFPDEIAEEVLRPTVADERVFPVDEFHRLLTEVSSLEHQLSLRDVQAFVDESLIRLAASVRTSLAEQLREVGLRQGSLAVRDSSWLRTAVDDVIEGRETKWLQLEREAAASLASVEARISAVASWEVNLPEGADLVTMHADASDLYSHLQEGGGFGVWLLRREPVRRAQYLINEAKVNGRAIKDRQSLQQLIEYLSVTIALRRAWNLWLEIVDQPPGTVSMQARILTEHLTSLRELLAFQAELQHARHALSSAMIPQPNWRDPARVTQLVEQVQSVALLEQLQSARTDLQRYANWLLHEAADERKHPVVADLAAAAAASDSRRYAAALARHDELRRQAAAIKARDELLTLTVRQLPSLVTDLTTGPADPAWDDRLQNIVLAWNWAQAKVWLHELDASQEVGALERDYQRLSASVAALTAELAAEKAWMHCFGRMTEEQRQHLVAWGKVVKRIGKASKYAVQRRKEAQHHMDKCRGAVPAWIMPFHRVTETIAPIPDQFDVVIVDEASQSGPETLLLTYIAKQIIIVGDDKQIAPEYVGYNEETVNQLIQRFLPDFDLGNTFGLKFSLFEHGEIRYGNRIVLREHFRCMPEIIRFSNDLSYRDSPLIPLRQYPAERLEPILTTHVENGYREGGSSRALNRPEADAIVDQIERCCADPRYAGKSMGVISLQGDTQAQYLEREIARRLPAQEIVSRQIVCGDAYAFQGDERDVMFLSLVAAPNERIGALTKETDQRRFNVAASRARDQMWLFHTARAQDLNPDDMRARLLRYMTSPASSFYEEPDFSKCDSQFEADVARAIHARGYRFYLQYQPLGPGGRRIDIVIEGAKARLAVECDGDYWHGPDQWDADMARQRQLERCGWEFWRIRGSDFYSDPKRSLEGLWAVLDRKGILPEAAEPETHQIMASDGAPKIESPVPAPGEPTIPPNDPDAEQRFDAGFQGPNRLSIRPAEPQQEFGTLTVDEAWASVRSTSIDDVPAEEIRAVFDAILSRTPKLDRETFLRKAAVALKFLRLGQKIRKRLNHEIAAEIKAGRLRNDWTTIERP